MVSLVASVLLTLLLIGSSQAICPAAEVSAPCVCKEEVRTTILCRFLPADTDVSAIFHRIAQHVPAGSIFDELDIEYGHIVELPANATAGLQFRSIDLGVNSKLTRIHPTAFHGSFHTARGLRIANSKIGTTPEDLADIYTMINSFTVLFKLDLRGSSVLSVPANAFIPNTHLKEVSYDEGRLTTIGDDAFSGLKSLQKLTLSGYAGNLKDSGISQHAFRGLAHGVAVDIEGSWLGFLDQSKFQSVLDTAKEVLLGGLVGCDPETNHCTYIKFHCDERIDWVCHNEEKYKKILKGVYGYKCSGQADNYVIWDYCKTLV